MADLTLSSGSIARPYRSPWGAFPTRTFPTASTLAAAIKLGQPVSLLLPADTSTNAGAVLGATLPLSFNMVGIAAGSCSSGVSSAVAGPSISVWEANPAVEFKAVTKGGTIGSSLIGKRRSLLFDSTLNIAWIDVTASTATDWRVLVTGLVDGEGDSGGYVSFRFLTATGPQVNSTILSSTPLLAFYS